MSDSSVDQEREAEAQAAFYAAIESGRLTLHADFAHYAGSFLYVGTPPCGHPVFIHKKTRDQLDQSGRRLIAQDNAVYELTIDGRGARIATAA